MKKLILCLLVILFTGCNSTTTVENPNGKSLAYKYFNSKNYDGSIYNLKLKTENSNITVSRQNNNVYYENKGNMDLVILEKNGVRYNINSNDKTYSKEDILKEENYVYGILPDDINIFKNKGYKTGKERIGIYNYVFETYNYDGVSATYYFKKSDLKYIRKQTDTENLIYEVISFDTKKKNNVFKIPKNYMELTY